MFISAEGDDAVEEPVKKKKKKKDKQPQAEADEAEPPLDGGETEEQVHGSVGQCADCWPHVQA